jgi:hypothetical protein
VAKGLLPPPDPAAPGIFALADPNRLTELVVGAGFQTPEIAEIPIQRRFADFDAYWRYLNELAGAISPVLRGLSPAAEAAIKDELRAAIAPFARRDGYAIPGLSLNAVTS